MSSRERTHKRSLIYNDWHRVDSTRRFIGGVEASKLFMIDVDAVECCCYCKAPLTLLELQESTRPPKSAQVVTQLAHMSPLPAFSVSWEPTIARDDIVAFQVRSLAPSTGPVWRMTPDQYARWLVSLRANHPCGQAHTRWSA